MSNNYSIKINRLEGTVEIVGDDKDWVAERLKELKIIYDHPILESKHPIEEPVDLKMPAAKSHVGMSTRKRGTGISLRAQKNPELVSLLTKEVRDKLESYVAERRTQFDRALPAQAAIIATFLQDELDWQGVDHHDMYTVYSTMGWVAPGNPRSQLNNALSRNQYFVGVTDGKYTLSHKGENYARHQSRGTE